MRIEGKIVYGYLLLQMRKAAHDVCDSTIGLRNFSVPNKIQSILTEVPSVEMLNSWKVQFSEAQVSKDRIIWGELKEYAMKLINSGKKQSLDAWISLFETWIEKRIKSNDMVCRNEWSI